MHVLYTLLSTVFAVLILGCTAWLLQEGPGVQPPSFRETDRPPNRAMLCSQYPNEFSSAERMTFVQAIHTHDENWLVDCQTYAIVSGFQPYIEEEMVRIALYGPGDAAKVVWMLAPRALRPRTELLLHAVFQEDVPAILALLERGVDPNTVIGQAPHTADLVLHRAAMTSPPTVIRTLLEGGASTTLRAPLSDIDQPTQWLNAYEWSLNNPHPQSRLLLKSAVGLR